MTLIQIVKKAAMDAVKASVPADIVYGVVTSASPLIIKTDQKLELDSDFLKLSRNVTTYTVPCAIETIGVLNVTFDNALKVGERVAMVKSQGGQSWLVLDRVVAE